MSEWIEWKGGTCPVGWTVLVDVCFRNGKVSRNEIACNWKWDYNRRLSSYDIIAYRIIKEGEE